MAIREYRPDDYDWVIKLWKEVGLPAKPGGRDSRRNIEKQIGLPNVLFLVAEAGGRIVGTVLATHDGRKGWINRLAVEAALRRRGLGSRLIAAAEKGLEAMGMEIFACLIEKINTASMGAFERHGYRKQPEICYFVKRLFPEV